MDSEPRGGFFVIKILDRDRVCIFREQVILKEGYTQVYELPLDYSVGRPPTMLTIEWKKEDQ